MDNFDEWATYFQSLGARYMNRGDAHEHYLGTYLDCDLYVRQAPPEEVAEYESGEETECIYLVFDDDDKDEFQNFENYAPSYASQCPLWVQQMGAVAWAIATQRGLIRTPVLTLESRVTH